MKNLIIYTALLLGLYASKTFAQETFSQRAESISIKIDNITKEEKAGLKKEIEEVNAALDKGLITKDQADFKKQQLAQTRATNIENRVSVEQLELKKLVQDKVDGKVQVSDSIIAHRFKFSVIEYKKHKNDTIRKGERRTTTQLVFAAGLNNVVTNGSAANSDFRYWGSHFYEAGLTWNYRLAKTDNLVHLKYGFSFMWNNLRPTDNRSFVVSGNQTNLQVNPISQDDSRFRNVYLVFPLHLEFDLSPTKIKNGKPFFQSHECFRFGVGGYLGTNLSSKQFIEYSANSYTTETETKGDFNTSNFIYGTSAYIGYSQTSLYVKYDLNPLFNNNTIKQNNISLGIRFDFN